MVLSFKIALAEYRSYIFQRISSIRNQERSTHIEREKPGHCLISKAPKFLKNLPANWRLGQIQTKYQKC